MHTLLYVQSDNSLKNSVIKPGSINNMLEGSGYDRAVLADDSLCAGIFGHQGPFGVKAFTSRDSQVLLLPKDYQGYQKMSRLVSEAGEELEDCRGVMLPVIDITKIEKGDIICIIPAEDGPLAAVYDRNSRLKERAEEIRGSLPTDLSDDAYMVNCSRLDAVRQQLKDMDAQSKELKAKALVDVDKKAKGLAMLLGISFEEAKKDLASDYEAKEEAGKKLRSLSRQITKKEREKDALVNARAETKREHDQKMRLAAEYETIVSEVLSDEDVEKEVAGLIAGYKGIFGEDLYIGISPYGDRHRGICGVPECALQSVHMEKEDQLPWWQSMRALRLKTWDNLSAGDYIKYMMSFEEYRQRLSAVYGPEAADRAIMRTDLIGSQLDVVIPDTPNYPKYRDKYGNIVKDAPGLLRQLAWKGVRERLGPLADTEPYRKAMEHELSVIIKLGYADYLLIVSDFIQYAKMRARQLDPTGVGVGVGPGRGSGAGSLVNYGLYITDLDPLAYGLRFERFLNEFRVSMPDIDTDFSQEVRGDAIEYVRKKYGKECVKMIMTIMTQGAKASLRNAGKVQDYYLSYVMKKPVSGDERYSSFSLLGTEMGKMVPKEVKSLKEVEGQIRERYKDDPNALMILDRALATENLMVGTSTHAAGVIIGDGRNLEDLVPLMDSRTGSTPGSIVKDHVQAVQCDMVQAEGILKLLKMDFLGLINLDYITETFRLICRRYGIRIDIDKIPFEREVFAEFAKGNTAYVFQFESAGMRKMLRQFRPEKFSDLILLVAAYRPGPMKFIPEIIDIKHGRKQVRYSIPALEPILRETYGKPIYQEQLMDIFHECAGFSLGEADTIRRYMSKKKEKAFLAYKPKFIAGFMEKGGSAQDAEAEWESYVDFANYGFNKSHAAVYAWISYVTAWLKYHYGVEYMTAILNKEEVKELPKALAECKRMGIKVLPPDINVSSGPFTIEGSGKVRYGLERIKGFRKEAVKKLIDERQKGSFVDYRDFLIRTDLNEKETKKLIACGCFDNCRTYRSRAVMIEEIDENSYLLDAYRTTSEKKYRQKAEYRERYLRERIHDGYAADDAIAFLADETELLGACISKDPLDAYKDVYRDSTISLTENIAPSNNTVIAGIASGIRILEDKQMFFFTVTDPTGSIECACFRDAFGLRNKVQEGGFVMVRGRTYYKEWGGDIRLQMAVRDIQMKDIQQPIRVYVGTKADRDAYVSSMTPYLSDKGRPVIIHVEEEGRFMDPGIRVFPDDAAKGPCYKCETETIGI